MLELVFLPLVGTLGTAKEQSSRLVCGTRLHLEVVCLGMCAFGTLGLCRGGAIPGLLAAKDVVKLLFREVGDFALDASDDTVDVRAGATLEAQMFAVFVGTGLVGDKTVGALLVRDEVFVRGVVCGAEKG